MAVFLKLMHTSLFQDNFHFYNNLILRTDRICDAVEVAGKNVMSTTSTVTTGLVTHK